MAMFDQDFNDAPTVREIWNRSHVARKAGRLCDGCKAPIEPGQRYESWGHVVDGVMEIATLHYGAYRYPSGCPKYAEQDRAEAEEQFKKDAAEVFAGRIEARRAETTKIGSVHESRKCPPR